MLSICTTFKIQVKVKIAQLCPTLLTPMDCSLPSSSVEFSKQEYWSGLPFSSTGALPCPGMEPESSVFLALQADS